MLSPSQLNWLHVGGLASVASERRTGVPAALSLAQSVFESGWGAHFSGLNNCFGIKANGRGIGHVIGGNARGGEGAVCHLAAPLRVV